MARCARSIHRWAIKARLSPEARLLISGQAPARLATYFLDSNAPRCARILCQWHHGLMIVAPSDGQMRSFYSQVGHCGPPVSRSWAIDKWPGAGEAGHLSFGPGIGLVDP